MNRIKEFFTLDRVLILLAACVLYANSLRNGYALDDGYVTQKDNVTAQGLKAIPQLFTSFYGVGQNGLQYDYRPLVKISFAIEHQFLGVSAGVSHFFNLALYVICLCLLYNFVRLLTAPANGRLPLYVTLLFVFLPIHTEVVASIKNRDILLCFIFTFQALILVLRALVKKDRANVRYGLAALCIFLAFLSKWDALPYLFLLPVILFLKFKASAKRVAVYAGAFLLVLIVARLTARLAIHGQVQMRPHFFFENPLYFEHGVALRVVAAFNSLGFYFVQCIFPFKQSCYYGADTIPIENFGVYAFIGLALAAVLAWGIFACWRKKNYNSLIGLLMFTVSISMYLNLVAPVVGIVGDRFVFFASAGFCIAFVFLLNDRFRIEKKLPSMLRNIGVLLLLIYGYMTIARNGDWKNAEVLVGKDQKKYPTSAYLNYLYATSNIRLAESREVRMSQQERQSRMLEAKTALLNSVRISKDYPNTSQLLAHIMILYEKNYKEALPYVNEALRSKKTSELIFYKALALEGIKNDSSEFYLKETIRIDSAAYNAYRVLGERYNSKGEYDKTLGMLKQAEQKGLKNETIYVGLATTYFMMKDSAEARAYCNKVLQLNPGNKRAQEILDKVRKGEFISPGAGNRK